MLARECLSEFRLDCELRRLSRRTVKGYCNNIARCLLYLEGEYGVVALEDIKPPHLKSYFQHLIGPWRSSSSGPGAPAPGNPRPADVGIKIQWIEKGRTRFSGASFSYVGHASSNCSRLLGSAMRTRMVAASARVMGELGRKVPWASLPERTPAR